MASRSRAQAAQAWISGAKTRTCVFGVPQTVQRMIDLVVMSVDMLFPCR